MSVQVKGSGTIGGLDEGLVVSGIVTSSTQINVGSNIKLGNAGVVTATSFVGSGANLTSLPAQATIANNADNRVITGGSGVNLNAESNVLYDGTTGLTTVTTQNPHDFSVNDQITMAGIAFTCSGTYGITTSIFPSPQAAFTVQKVGVGNTNFETNTGIVKTLPHFFIPSLHRFIRADKDPISVVSGNQNGNKIQVVSGTTYDSKTGILSVTASAPHKLESGDTIQFTNESLVFKCSQDNFFKEKKYPRSTDPAAKGNPLGVSTFVGIANTFTVNVGVTTTGGLVGPLQMEFICSILENSTT